MDDEEEVASDHRSERRFWEDTFISVLPAISEGRLVPQDTTVKASEMATRAVMRRREAFKRLSEVDED